MVVMVVVVVVVVVGGGAPANPNCRSSSVHGSVAMRRIYC
jgi:hypothetical protein